MSVMIGLSVIVVMYLATIIYFIVDMTIEIVKDKKERRKL